MTTIHVDPSRIIDAAYALSQCRDEVGYNVADLIDTLQSSGAIAGSDPIGMKWAANYDPAAQEAVSTAASILRALDRYGYLLGVTAENHLNAENKSVIPGQGLSGWEHTDRAGDTTLADTYTPPTASLPSASGGSTGPPTGWGLIQAAVGMMWPNGHQDRLNECGDAWMAAARSLLTYRPDAAMSALSDQVSPEMDAVMTHIVAADSAMGDLSANFADLGQACYRYANVLDHAHHQIIEEIKSFIEWTAGIQIAGGLFSFVTAGLSEAAAQSVQAAKIAATAAKVAGYITELSARVDEVVQSVARAFEGFASVTRVAMAADGVGAVRIAAVTAKAIPRITEVSRVADETGVVTKDATVFMRGQGNWTTVKEGMSTRSAAYQAQISGVDDGSVYVVQGVKFDGYDGGVLQDAKGPGYAKFVDSNGEFKPWYKGADDLVAQARRQLAAAGGKPITWSIAEPRALEAITNLFEDNGITGIKLVHVPVK